MGCGVAASSHQQRILPQVCSRQCCIYGRGWAVKEFSWDNKYTGVQILLSKVLVEGKAGSHASTLKQYQAKADYFACACLQKNDGYNVQKTPGLGAMICLLLSQPGGKLQIQIHWL